MALGTKNQFNPDKKGTMNTSMTNLRPHQKQPLENL